jgi:cytochrome c-type biogenesis protein
VRDGWLNIGRMYAQMLNIPSLLSLALFDAGASAASPIAAFGAGVLSFLSPCVLPLVPGYVSMISGATIETLEKADDKLTRKKVFVNSLMFIMGFSVVFIAAGAAATTIGQMLLAYRPVLARVAGIVIFVFGLHLTGILKITALYSDKRLHNLKPGTSAYGAFIIGFAFAFGWTPCIGPILGAILTLAQYEETVLRGSFLLAVYSLGLAVPFFLTSIGVKHFFGFYRRFSRHLHTVEIVTGVLLMLLGVLIFFNEFTRLSGYFGFLTDIEIRLLKFLNVSH